MTIRVTFADQLLTIDLYDNASARELAAMLPLDLTISDFGGNEKIAYLPQKLADLARGPFPNAAPGDLCYYVPWGNLAFFHGSYQSTRDLVRLGRPGRGSAASCGWRVSRSRRSHLRSENAHYPCWLEAVR